MNQQQINSLYTAMLDKPALDTIKVEIEKDLDLKPASLADHAVVREPEAYVAHARRMLAIARDRRIAAQALHEVRRAKETQSFNDRLLNMDEEYAKLVRQLSALISKLEVLTS